MPSKLTGILASGRPVVATARRGTEVAKVVEGNGLVVSPDNVNEFADAILRLARTPSLRAELGRSARVYAVEHLDKEVVLVQFEHELVDLTERKHGHVRSERVD